MVWVTDMMNVVWTLIILGSVFCGLITGNGKALSDAVLSGGGQAVELCLSLLGMMVLWSGLSAVMEESGLACLFGRWLSPVVSFLFPELKLYPEAKNAIALNVAANMMGLGNAATPLGLKAMAHLQRINPNPKVATNSMVTFVVLNSVSVQLIPTGVAVLRAKFGAQNPMDVTGIIWITSLLGAVVGLLAANVLNQRRKTDECH